MSAVRAYLTTNPSGWKKVAVTIFCCLFAVALTTSSVAQSVEVPSAARQMELEASIRDTYELTSTKSKAEKLAILERLVKAIETELQTKQINHQSYAALTVALRLASETSQVSRFQSLLKTIETHFAITDEKFTGSRVREYLKFCTTKDDFELSWPTLIAIALEHAESKKFDSSLEMLSAAATAAKGKSETARKKLNGMVVRVAKRKESHGRYALATNRLEKEPDNPKANFAVGYWLAVYESKWVEAGRYLAKGDQEKWKIASQLSSTANTPEERLSAADAWWNVSATLANKTEDADAAVAVRNRLLDIYTSLQSQVSPGIAKDTVTSRLSKIKAANEAEAASLKPDVTVTANPSIPKKSVAESPVSELLPGGAWIDALDMVRLPEDGILGTWQYKNHVLSCEASTHATCRLPVIVRGNYEFECTFVRHRGTDCIGFAVPLDNGFCDVVLSMSKGTASGLMLVDGKWVLDLDSKTSNAAVRPGTILNEAIHLVQVSVGQANGIASISATINGQTFISWQGAVSRLSSPERFNLNCPEALGVFAQMGLVDFRSFQVRVLPERTLKGVAPYSCAYRLGTDWLTPITAIKDVPPSEVSAQCKIWNKKSYYFSKEPMYFTLAQCLAKQLGGRLLTVSSDAENEFIMNEGKGLWIWTSANRRSMGQNWADERHRPLSYTGKFCPGQPNNGEWETQIGLITGRGPDSGWHDMISYHSGLYACIEWGEEYPEEKK